MASCLLVLVPEFYRSGWNDLRGSGQYVQQILGHADLTTTSRYLATTRKGLHAVMERYQARVQTRVNFSEIRGSQRP